MKIFIDSCLHRIYDAEDDQLIFCTKGPYDFEDKIEKLLNNSQQKRLMEQDGEFVLSKKAEKYLNEIKNR